MDITIKRNIVQELDCSNIKIKLMSKGIKAAMICLFLGIGLIIVCRNDIGVTVYSTYCYFLFEIFLFSISFMILKRMYNYRKIYKTFAKSALTDYGNIDVYSTINIDDSFFTFQSLRTYYKLSWSSFVKYELNIKYELKDENIILLIDGTYNTGFIIKRNELSPAEFGELVKFIAQKIPISKK
jgi:hypothetical protein